MMADKEKDQEQKERGNVLSDIPSAIRGSKFSEEGNKGSSSSLKDRFSKIMGKSQENNSKDSDSIQPVHKIVKLNDIGTQRDTKYINSDLDTLSERVSELEEHVIELHSTVDKFMLDAEKYMSYEQFLELRREIDEKIKTLDSLDKSLGESRDLIMKDSKFMEEIILGLENMKNKIGKLEKNITEIKNGEPSVKPIIGRILGTRTVGDKETHDIGASAIEINEIKKQMEEINSKISGKEFDGKDYVEKYVQKMMEQLRDEIRKEIAETHSHATSSRSKNSIEVESSIQRLKELSREL